jgi:hypothetical protein
MLIRNKYLAGLGHEVLARSAAAPVTICHGERRDIGQPSPRGRTELSVVVQSPRPQQRFDSFCPTRFVGKGNRSTLVSLAVRKEDVRILVDCSDSRCSAL